MRLLILLVVVGVCLVSAKYLPDESNNFKQLLSRHKRSDSEDSLDESNSNDTDDLSDEELREQSKLHARIEKMRQKLIQKQEKERRRQEEAQQKLEEKITKELQKEEERRQKEEERRQKELQKEEERRQKELQKEEEIRQKEEEKRQKELLKHEEKLEKERIKLEERQKKLREKTFENEQKRQEMLQKQLEEIEEETLKLQEGDSNSSNTDTDESTELEDFWKSYIYAKYGLNESNTDLEKRIALRRYMQEELGLNVNSTESERRQAILRLIESKWQAVSEQYVLQSQMTDFVNRVGVERIRAQIEKEIEEINNKTDILNNVNLPWVQLARDNFAEQVSFLQTIKEFLASILPNWYSESIPSTQSTFNEASSQNEKVTSIPSENQNRNVFESPIVISDLSNQSNSLSNTNNPNAINTPAIPILSENSGSNSAVDASSTILDKNPSPAIGNSGNEGSGTRGADDAASSIIIDGNTNKLAASGTVGSSDIDSTTVTGIAPGSDSDFTDVASNLANEVNNNGSPNDGTNSISKPITTNLISNRDVSSSVISKDTSLPSATGSNVAVDSSSTILDKDPSPAIETFANEGSGTKGANDAASSIITDSNTNKLAASGTVVISSDIDSTTVTAIAPGSGSDFADVTSNFTNEVNNNGSPNDRTNSISKPITTNLISNRDVSSSVISKDALLPSDKGSNVAIDSASTILDKDLSPTIGNPANEGSGTKGADDTGSSMIIDVNTNKPAVSGTVGNISDMVSTTIKESTPDSTSDLAPVESDSKTNINSNGFTIDGMNSALGTNTNGIIPAISESRGSNLINNNNSSPSVISTDAPLPAATSVTSGASLNNEQDGGSSVDANVVPFGNQESISKTSDSINNVDGKTKTDDLLISKTKNNIVNEANSDTAQPTSEYVSIKTNVNSNLPSTDGSDDSLNGPTDKMNSLNIDQDTSVTLIPAHDLSTLVTKIMSSLITTEASEVAPQVSSDLGNTANNANEANNNLTHLSNAPLLNNLVNNGNILPSTTERSGLNIIKSIDETGIRNNLEEIVSTASNIAISTDAAIYSGSSPYNDNNVIVTLSPAPITESQDSASSISNDSTNTGKSDITADLITTVIPESSNKIVAPNAEPVQPIVDVATNEKNEDNVNSISTSPIDNVIDSHTNNIFSSKITPNDATGNNEKTISILIPTTESPNPIVNESIDNLHLEGVDAVSRVDDQNVSKTFDVTENQNSSEPLTISSSTDLDNVASTVSDATYEKDGLIITSLSPSTIVTNNLDVASKGANITNSDIIISKNTSTHPIAVSDAETTELPVSVTDSQTTVLDQSTSFVSDAQQVANDVTENQYTETDVTLSDTGIPTVTESGNSDSFKDRKNPIDTITVPVEPGASVIGVAQQ